MNTIRFTSRISALLIAAAGLPVATGFAQTLENPGADLSALDAPLGGVGAPGGENVPNELDYPHNPNRVLLRLRAGADQAAADQLLASLGDTRHRYTLVPRLVSLSLGEGVNVSDALAALRNARDLIEYAEADYLMFNTAVPNDPLYANNLYGLNNTGQNIAGRTGTPGSDINAEEAWDITTGQQDFLVAIIDGGTDPSHIDLQANIWTNPDEVPGNGIDDDNNGYVDDVNGWDFFDDDNNTANDADHGTHVSGTVGAKGNNGIGVTGVNWDVTLIPLKFIGPFSGSTSDAIRAIEYAVAEGATVSNNSWGGGGFSSSLQSAIANAAAANGHIFVAAAGNDGQNSASYPARYDLDNIISVAATNNRDEIAGFSNRSTTNVDIAAPGVDVASTVPGNNYSFFSGTSMASPHVAGVVALVRSEAPSLDYADVIDVIFSNGRFVSGLANLTVTGRVVDAGAALNNLNVAPSLDFRTTPEVVAPGLPFEIVIDGDPGTDAIISDSGLLHYSINGGAFQTSPIDHNANNTTFLATLPALACGDQIEFFLTVESANFGTITLPEGAPSAAVMSPQVGEIVGVFADTFNTDQGWTVSNSPGLTDGAWQRGQPVGFNRGNPTADADASGFAFLTDNDSSTDNSDVDNGSTTLTSPVFDASNGAVVSYRYWLNDVPNGELTTEDGLLVEVSTNGGSSWSVVRDYGAPSASWRSDSFDVAPTSQLRVRFTASDLGSQNVVEAALDAFAVDSFDCVDPDLPCAGDATGDGLVDGADLLAIINNFGAAASSGDLTDDGLVDGADLLEVINNFGAACP